MANITFLVCHKMLIRFVATVARRTSAFDGVMIEGRGEPSKIAMAIIAFAICWEMVVVFASRFDAIMTA